MHTIFLRMVHEGLTMASPWPDDIVLGVKCIPECVLKASLDYPMLCKNQLNKSGLSIDIISQPHCYICTCRGIVYFICWRQMLGVLEWSWAAVLSGFLKWNPGGKVWSGINTFLKYKETFRHGY